MRKRRVQITVSPLRKSVTTDRETGSGAVMKIYSLKCPNCGATLATDVKNNRARCEYCGNEFYISEETQNAADKDRQEDEGKVLTERAPEEGHPPEEPKGGRSSHTRELLIFSLFLIVGLALNFLFDKESPRDIVPQTDLHRFFIELQPDSTPQQVEALAKKHKLYFFRIEKASNSETTNISYYKIAKTGETALNKQGAHAETVEVEFDMAKNNAFRLAVYSDPDHIVSRAILFQYGTYYSLSAEAEQDMAGYYYYNNSLRSAPGDKQTNPPYLKCANAVEALKKIYTYRK